MSESVNNQKKRDGFKSSFGVIAAAAGSAIGLGNIWKFPYMVGKNGGAAFIIIYLICIVVVGLPVMMSELVIGRRAKKNVVGAFKKLAPNTPWHVTGWIGMIAGFLIMCFYCIVAGWTLEYLMKAITGSFSGQSAESLHAMFDSFVASGWRPIMWAVIVMALSGLILAKGISDGIEKYTKFLMPLLVIIILILDVRSLTLPGASEGLRFLFKPDWSAINGKVILAALGHAFFSLSLGQGIMVTFGSYINKKEKLGMTAVNICIADTLIAIIAGIAIFPAVFAFGVNPEAGSGLVFVTLPVLFNQMPGGFLFSIMFFILLAVAAITSIIGTTEVTIAFIIEKFEITRKKAAILITSSISFVGIFVGLSMGPWKARFFGMNLLDLFDWTTANLMLPVVALLCVIFVAWFMGTDNVKDELTNNGEEKAAYYPWLMFASKYIAPIIIVVIFLNGIGVIKF